MNPQLRYKRTEAQGDTVMDEDLKKGLKKIAKTSEIKMAESILRWKHKKEGRPLPDQESMEQQSKQVAERAHKALARSGKSIWNGLKKAYKNGRKKEDAKD
jgi:hypothetical protein